VVYAEPNYVVQTFAPPDDPSFPLLWGLDNVGQAVNTSGAGVAGADISAVGAWDLSLGSAAHVIGIVDTGLDYTHPDLAANVWTAPSAFTVTIGGVPVSCPAGSHGFNALTMSCDPMDDHNHGTHVAGIIGAAGNNGLGVAGVSWTTRLMGLKFLNAGGSGTVAALTGSADVRVLSNSWGGGPFSQALLDEIDQANENDMLFVAAAGNNGWSNDILPTYPASYDAPNVISHERNVDGCAPRERSCSSRAVAMHHRHSGSETGAGRSRRHYSVAHLGHDVPRAAERE
jgi:subtilisin family serine protease